LLGVLKMIDVNASFAWAGRRRGNTGALAAIAFVAAMAAGCGDTVAPGATSCAPSGSPAGTAPVPGAVQVALLVPPSVQIASFTYQVTRGSFSTSGSIDVSHSGTLTGVIGGLPAGTGYQLALSATDPSQKLTGCSGMATFDVVGGTVTPVPIDVTCRLTPPAAAPMVPVPFRAVVLLAGALLGAGLMGSGRSRRGGGDR
jgi:hypothetical protein